MAAERRGTKPSTPRRPPATTPEARELQMVALAVDVAEQQMRDGTASAAVITHYLKLASSREKLEQERLSRENVLLAAKAEAIASEQRIEGLMKDALTAFSVYAGNDPVMPDED